jgi:hypothetical protein
MISTLNRGRPHCWEQLSVKTHMKFDDNDENLKAEQGPLIRQK